MDQVCHLSILRLRVPLSCPILPLQPNCLSSCILETQPRSTQLISQPNIVQIHSVTTLGPNHPSLERGLGVNYKSFFIHVYCADITKLGSASTRRPVNQIKNQRGCNNWNLWPPPPPSYQNATTCFFLVALPLTHIPTTIRPSIAAQLRFNPAATQIQISLDPFSIRSNCTLSVAHSSSIQLLLSSELASAQSTYTQPAEYGQLLSDPAALTFTCPSTPSQFDPNALRMQPTPFRSHGP